jgi:hypothetical protein
MTKVADSTTERGVLEKYCCVSEGKQKKLLLTWLPVWETWHVFFNALLVTDRFHVQKLAYDGLHKMRL